MTDMVERLRRLESSDLDDAMALVEQAGWNQLRVDWDTFLALAPGGCFALEKGGEVVATSTAVTYPSAGEVGASVGWIGMVLVREDARCQGHGTRLFDTALRQLEQAGAEAALDATPAGRPLYEKRGFRVVGEVERWTGVLARSTPFTTAGRQLERADLDPLLRLDTLHFGADRSCLLGALLARPRARGHAVGPPGAPRGYVLSRSGRRFLHLGPLVASSTADGLALLESALARRGGERVGIDIRPQHREITRRLEELGLRPERALVRMARPEGTSPAGRAPGGDPRTTIAIAGPEWG